jgi:PAS domain S-box-containing protein
MMGVALEITDRKRAEEEINRREAQLVTAQRIATLGSYEWDLSTDRVYRSEELCRIFGVDPHEFKPTYEGYLERIHPDDRSTTEGIINRAFEAHTSFDFEERIIRPDGTIRVLRSQGQWTFDAARRPIRLIGICQDITDRKQAEQQLQAVTARLIGAHEEERARIARELHDDLSQQIAVLSMAASNLKKDIAQRDRIQQKLVQLAESIRRISHDLHPAVLEHSGLAAALQSYCSEFGSVTGIRVQFQTQGSFESVPAATALCLYRVTQEALQNVAKHARVVVAHVELAASSEMLRLTISDRGIGMNTIQPGAPLGLGLVSIKERARAVNGTVNIESEPNQGTTLTVTVPCGTGFSL